MKFSFSPEEIGKKIQHFKLPFSFKTLKYITYGFISIGWIGAFFSGYNSSTGNFFWGEAVSNTGELAWKLLIFTIFISLFQKLFPKIKIFAQLLPLRKFTGIFAFSIAFSHLLAALMNWDFLDYPFLETLPLITDDIGMIFGMVSFLAMLPAFITSTHWAIQKMGGKLWKNIQRLSHIAFVFAVLHIVFLRYHYTQELELEAIFPLAIYLIGYGYIFWKKYPFYQRCK